MARTVAMMGRMMETKCDGLRDEVAVFRCRRFGLCDA